jgi:hypothetical protein
VNCIPHDDLHTEECIKGIEPCYADDFCDEPCYDDTVLCCPDCERPNQFGELCVSCQQERANNSPNYEIEDSL